MSYVIADEQVSGCIRPTAASAMPKSRLMPDVRPVAAAVGLPDGMPLAASQVGAGASQGVWRWLQTNPPGLLNRVAHQRGQTINSAVQRRQLHPNLLTLPADAQSSRAERGRSEDYFTVL